jgi:hypothetical protein
MTNNRTKLVFCPICDFTYLTDLASDVRRHRKYHAESMRAIDPPLDERLTELPPGDVRVDAASPTWLHRLVYERARALKREEHYDFVQWSEDHAPKEDHQHKQIHAWLLIEEGRAVGVAAFAYIHWVRAEPGWSLQMVWIAPPYRRRGLLQRRWPVWKEEYGDFRCATPWSAAFENFLAKVGAPARQKGLVSCGAFDWLRKPNAPLRKPNAPPKAEQERICKQI